MTAFYIISGVLIFLVLLYFFLIFPRRRKSDFFARHTLFAHRGLYDNKEIPENSLTAFAKAAEAGYGIELDTHITSDGVTVVFHDDTLTRMCGVEGTIEKMTYAELCGLRLGGTDEKIPTFDEVLALVNGRVPLIVEVKGTTTDTAVCAKTAERLDNYGGEYCIESFNPFYVKWFGDNRPDVIRGQLSCRMRDGKKLSIRLRDFLLENMLLNFLSRPDFAAYCIDDCDKLSFRLARAFGAVPVAWTVRSQDELEKSKRLYTSFIFEKFIPADSGKR